MTEARKLDSIRLDDTILEEGLQPPTHFKVADEKQSRIVLRKEFPETWIWANVTTGYSRFEDHFLFSRILFLQSTALFPKPSQTSSLQRQQT